LFPSCDLSSEILTVLSFDYLCWPPTMRAWLCLSHC
jgi:hypothetical protein